MLSGRPMPASAETILPVDAPGVEAEPEEAAVSATPEPTATPTPSEEASSGSSSHGENPADISFVQYQNVLTVGTENPEGTAPPETTTPDPGAFPSEEPGEPEETDPLSKSNVHAQGAFDPERPMVALTFDDGPGKATGRIVDLLEQYDCRATFFVVGSVADKNRSMLSRIAEQGSELANHTWAHHDLTKMTYEAVYEQLNDTNRLIEEVTGIWPSAIRPVGGSYTEDVMRAAEALNMSVVNWSVDTKDWKKREADSVYEAVMKDVKDGSIVICHDLYPSTADAMERVIPELLEQGYQLVTVSELLSMRSGGMQPGMLYTRK